jgi:hypothetical protein
MMTPSEGLTILEQMLRLLADLQRGLHRPPGTACMSNCADLSEVQALLVNVRERLEDAQEGER